MTGREISRVAVVHWQQGSGLTSALLDTLSGLGYEAISLAHDAKAPEGVDAALACGPFGSLVPLVKQLLDRPPSRRPAFALWMTEQLCNPAYPEWVVYPISRTRSWVERLAFREQNREGEWCQDSHLRWFTTRANRFRYYGDLHWMWREQVLSVLAVGSQWIAHYLQARGFDPLVAYIGSHHDWWADMQLERDIPVLWLGKTATRRRRRILRSVREGLAKRGVEMLVVDGEENPYVFGEARTVLLNRSCIVLNILRTKWDNHSLRYFLAAPNRALIVTEPTYPHTPFLPGVHLVEAPVDRLVDAICYYLSHEEERSAITDQAYHLAVTELTMDRTVSGILEHVAGVSQ